MTGADAAHAHEPWWASGEDGLAPEPDPLTAHRSARHHASGAGHGAAPSSSGRPDDPGGADSLWDRLASITADSAAQDQPGRSSGTDGDHGRHGEPRGPLDDVTEGLTALVRAMVRRSRRDGPGRGQSHDGACRSCPWCLLSRALGDARPEVAEHLEQATRHVVLAARAWVDAADEHAGWQAIPIDDEEQQ